MLKRILALMMILVLSLGLAACGKDDDDKDTSSKTEKSKDDDEDEEDKGGEGYYIAVACEKDGDDGTADIKSMKDIKMGIFLVLEKDGTGLLDVYGQKYDLTYDKKTANIEVEGDEFEVPLKWKKNQYVLEDFMDSTMKFERASKSEKKEYKNGEWNESFELDGPGTEDVDNGDYNWISLDNLKGDLDDVEAADATYSDQDYCTEGVITEICTDEGLEGVKIALSKKDADNFFLHFYIYEDEILEKAQEIGVGNEAKVWFHVNGVNDWYGYDCSIVALDEPGSDFPGGGSGSGSDEDDWDDTGSTSFILPDLSSGPHDDQGYYAISSFEENGQTYSKKDLEEAGVEFDMMLRSDGTGYAHFIGVYYDLAWTDGTIVVDNEGETEEMVYTLSKSKGETYITIADSQNGIAMTFEWNGYAER